MTPDSSISSQRSLPSRVRSPTPANTETPPCCIATLWISSWIEHRLADAGAAEEADLAALDVRRDQVDDLDARSRRSRSSATGRGRPAGRGGSASARRLRDRPASRRSARRSRSRGGRASPSPTGTEIGAPVSTTSVPRARPSVESIATARTRSSPRCCCTSATSVRGRAVAARRSRSRARV